MKTKVMLLLGVFLLPVLGSAQENKETGRVVTRMNENGVSFTVPRTNITLDSADAVFIEQKLNEALHTIDLQRKLLEMLPGEGPEASYEKLKNKTAENCPRIKEEQSQKILEDVAKTAGKSLRYYTLTPEYFDVRCYEKAELNITTALGSREKPGTREFTDTVFFFFRDFKYDDGFEWYEWMVLAYDISTGTRIYKHDFDMYTNTITLTNVLNPQEKFTYDGRVPR